LTLTYTTPDSGLTYIHTSRVQSGTVPLSLSDRGQSFTTRCRLVPITGGDALKLGRQPQAWQTVTAAYSWACGYRPVRAVCLVNGRLVNAS